MSKYFSVNEMKHFIISELPSDAILIDFIYDSKCFGNMIAKIKQNGKVHTFITDRGEIYHNNEMLCDSSYRYKEKEDTFPKLLQMIKIVLNQ
jgi:hypothetical protein